MICAEVVPDRPLRFDLGGTAIVPGECAQAPAKGGLVRIAVDDGRNGGDDYRWIRAPRGRVTWVSVRDDRLWLRVDRRQRCDREPFAGPE